MTETLVIRIVGAPVPKGRPRFAKIAGFVRAYTPSKTAKYEARVKKLAVAEMMRSGVGRFEGPISVTIEAKLPIPKSWSRKRREHAILGSIMPTGRLDTDNIAKALLDSCNGAVFIDDGQIVDLVVRKRYGEPEVVMTIRSLDLTTQEKVAA